MVSQVVASLQQSIPDIRMQEYLPQGGTQFDMLTNYFWDISLAESLVPCLHGVELALRNSIHSNLSLMFDDPMWFYIPGVLEPGQLAQLAGALRQIADRKSIPTDGRIVAELSFGFWVTLISDPYQQRLWQPDKYALLKSVFPHATGRSRQDIHRRYNDIRKHLRNRVFHHEAIWDRQTLLQDHRNTVEAIEWINPDLAAAIRAIDRFQHAYADRSQIEVRVRSAFGI